jgi:aspartokinase
MKFRIQQPQWRLLNIHNDLCFWPSLFPAITVHEMSAGGRILPSKQIRSLEKSKILRISKQVEKYHNQILLDLFEDDKNAAFTAVKAQFSDLEYFLAHNKFPNYNFVYDQVVSYGELISTTILAHFMNHMGIK